MFRREIRKATPKNHYGELAGRFTRYAHLSRWQHVIIWEHWAWVCTQTDQGHAMSITAKDVFSLTDRQWNSKIGADVFAAVCASVCMSTQRRGENGARLKITAE